LRRQPAGGVPFWTCIVACGVLRFIGELFGGNPQYLVRCTNNYVGSGVLAQAQISTPLSSGRASPGCVGATA